MGAAWVLRNDYRAILLPGFDYQNIDGAVDPREVSMKLDHEAIKDHLEDFKGQLEKKFNLRPISHRIWEKERDKFLAAIAALPISPGATINVKDKQITSLQSEFEGGKQCTESEAHPISLISVRGATEIANDPKNSATNYPKITWGFDTNAISVFTQRFEDITKTMSPNDPQYKVAILKLLSEVGDLQAEAAFHTPFMRRGIADELNTLYKS